jgi:hypothetical protein
VSCRMTNAQVTAHQIVFRAPLPELRPPVDVEAPIDGRTRDHERNPLDHSSRDFARASNPAAAFVTYHGPPFSSLLSPSTRLSVSDDTTNDFLLVPFDAARVRMAVCDWDYGRRNNSRLVRGNLRNTYPWYNLYGVGVRDRTGLRSGLCTKETATPPMLSRLRFGARCIGGQTPKGGKQDAELSRQPTRKQTNSRHAVQMSCQREVRFIPSTEVANARRFIRLARTLDIRITSVHHPSPANADGGSAAAELAVSSPRATNISLFCCCDLTTKTIQDVAFELLFSPLPVVSLVVTSLKMSGLTTAFLFKDVRS